MPSKSRVTASRFIGHEIIACLQQSQCAEGTRTPMLPAYAENATVRRITPLKRTVAAVRDRGIEAVRQTGLQSLRPQRSSYEVRLSGMGLELAS